MIIRIAETHSTGIKGQPALFHYPNPDYVGFSTDGKILVGDYFTISKYQISYITLIFPEKTEPLEVGTVITLTQE